MKNPIVTFFLGVIFTVIVWLISEIREIEIKDIRDDETIL